MRLAACLLLTLAACADAPAEAPVTETATATVAIDTLRRDEPGRGLRVAVGVPQIQRKARAPRAPLLQAVNAALRDTVRALTDDLRPERPPRGAAPVAVVAQGGPTRLWLTDDAFSALVEVAVSVDDAPDVGLLLPLTIDLRTGAFVTPADLFREGTPWADTLAAHVERDVSRQLAGRAPFFPAGLDALRDGRVALTLGPDGVTVHVPASQLSSDPSAFHVEVPLAAVSPFALPDGLLGRETARLGAEVEDQGTPPSPDRTVGTD